MKKTLAFIISLALALSAFSGLGISASAQEVDAWSENVQGGFSAYVANQSTDSVTVENGEYTVTSGTAPTKPIGTSLVYTLDSAVSTGIVTFSYDFNISSGAKYASMIAGLDAECADTSHYYGNGLIIDGGKIIARANGTTLSTILTYVSTIKANGTDYANIKMVYDLSNLKLYYYFNGNLNTVCVADLPEGFAIKNFTVAAGQYEAVTMKIKNFDVQTSWDSTILNKWEPYVPEGFSYYLAKSGDSVTETDFGYEISAPLDPQKSVGTSLMYTIPEKITTGIVSVNYSFNINSTKRYFSMAAGETAQCADTAVLTGSGIRCEEGTLFPMVDGVKDSNTKFSLSNVSCTGEDYIELKFVYDLNNHKMYFYINNSLKFTSVLSDNFSIKNFSISLGRYFNDTTVNITDFDVSTSWNPDGFNQWAEYIPSGFSYYLADSGDSVKRINNNEYKIISNKLPSKTIGTSLIHTLENPVSSGIVEYSYDLSLSSAQTYFGMIAGLDAECVNPSSISGNGIYSNMGQLQTRVNGVSTVTGIYTSGINCTNGNYAKIKLAYDLDNDKMYFYVNDALSATVDLPADFAIKNFTVFASKYSTMDISIKDFAVKTSFDKEAFNKWVPYLPEGYSYYLAKSNDVVNYTNENGTAIYSIEQVATSQGAKIGDTFVYVLPRAVQSGKVAANFSVKVTDFNSTILMTAGPDAQCADTTALTGYGLYYGWNRLNFFSNGKFGDNLENLNDSNNGAFFPEFKDEFVKVSLVYDLDNNTVTAYVKDINYGTQAIPQDYVIKNFSICMSGSNSTNAHTMYIMNPSITALSSEYTVTPFTGNTLDGYQGSKIGYSFYAGNSADSTSSASAVAENGTVTVTKTSADTLSGNGAAFVYSLPNSIIDGIVTVAYKIRAEKSDASSSAFPNILATAGKYLPFDSRYTLEQSNYGCRFVDGYVCENLLQLASTDYFTSYVNVKMVYNLNNKTLTMYVNDAPLTMDDEILCVDLSNSFELKYIGISFDKADSYSAGSFTVTDFSVTTNDYDAAIDLNDDGISDDFDLSLIEQYILGLDTPDSQQLEKANINKDGSVSILDLLLLKANIALNTLNKNIIVQNMSTNVSELPMLQTTAPGDAYNLPQVNTATEYAPVISSLTGSAEPGNIINVSGGNFGNNPKVMVYAKTSATEGKLYYAQVMSASTGSQITAMLDGAVPFGVYAVWVDNGYGYSNVMRVNAPETTWISNNAISAAGASASIYGKNLSVANAVNHIYLQNTATHEITEAEISSADNYKVNFNIPAALSDGIYKVYVHNGEGGNFGWSNALELTVQENTENWNSEVYNVKDYGAAGDGLADDTAAIKLAISKATSGSTVYFPAGTYLVSGRLDTYKSLKFVGDNSSTSVLKVTTSGDYLFDIKNPSVFDKLGFVDTLVGDNNEGSNLSFTFIYYYGANNGVAGKTNLSVTNCSFEKQARSSFGNIGFKPSITVNTATGVFISDNTFKNPISVVSIKSDYMTFTGNIMYGRYRINDNNVVGAGANGLEFSKCNNVDICGNTIKGEDALSDETGNLSSGDLTFARAIVFGLGTGGADGVYIANNITDRIGHYATNVGEQFLFEHDYNVYQGTVASSTSNTVTLNNEYMLNSKGISAGMWAIITDGMGAGQYRQIDSSDGYVIVLKDSWTIIPDETSKIVVTYAFNDVVIYDNTMSSFNNHSEIPNASCFVSFYGNELGCIVANNNMSNAYTGVMIYAKQSDQKNFNIAVAYDNMVINNNISNVTSGIDLVYSIYITYLYSPYTLARNNIIRSNTVSNVTEAVPAYAKGPVRGYGISVGRGYKRIDGSKIINYNVFAVQNTIIENNALSDVANEVIFLKRNQKNTVVNGNTLDGTLDADIIVGADAKGAIIVSEPVFPQV